MLKVHPQVGTSEYLGQKKVDENKLNQGKEGEKHPF